MSSPRRSKPARRAKGAAATAPPPGPHRLVRLLPWLAVLLAVVVFAGAYNFPFVDDDNAMIVNHPHMTSWAYAPHYFLEDAWGQSGKGSVSNYYRPLQELWLRTNYALFGLDPKGYHAAAIALHALVTLLVYLLAFRALKDRIAAGFAALVFAVHPIHVEVVAWISGSTESQCAVFYLAAMLCYLRGRENTVGARLPAPGWSKWFVASLLCYGLALLSKETAVTLLALVFFCGWFYGSSDAEETGERRAWRPRLAAAVRSTLPFAGITVLYLAARVAVLHGLTPEVFKGRSSGALLLTLPQVLWFYLRELVWPLPLAFHHDLRILTRADWAHFAWPLGASLASLAGLLLWSRRSAPAAAASAWLLFPLAVPLLAVRNFPSVYLVADRFLYLPSVGLAMLAALALRRIGPRSPEAGGIPLAQSAALLPLICLLGAISVQQTGYWSSQTALYRHSLEVSPHGPNALIHMAALEAGENHDFTTGLKLADQAVAEAPSDVQILLTAALMRRKVNDFDSALALGLRARDLDPEARYPHYLLGVLYSQKNDLGASEAEYCAAIRLAPTENDQHLGLGFVLQRQNRLAEARQEYETELQINPGSANAARLLAELGK